MGDYKDLLVWERAHQLTLATYSITRAFPREELFGVSAQMRRAAASIPANLAEGCGRGSDRELVRFSRIALGSASALEYFMRLSRDLGYLPAHEEVSLGGDVAEIKAMLAALARSLSNRPKTEDRRPKTED